MAEQLMPDAFIDKVAQRFKMLSEPIRLRILNQLQLHDEMNVQELVDAMQQRQATVSKHLALLTREGILSRRKEGLHVYYRLNDPSIAGMCMLVCARLKDEAREHSRVILAD